MAEDVERREMRESRWRDRQYFRRQERKTDLLVKAGAHLLWAAVALTAVFVLADALREARPIQIDVPATPGVRSALTTTEAGAVVSAVRGRPGAPRSSLPLAEALALVRSLVDAGTISVEAGRTIAEKITDTAIASGGQITVNTIEQMLDRLLKGEIQATTSASGDTIIQTCAPTLACPYEK